MAKHHKHYAKKMRLGSKNNPVAKSGLMFGLVFGSLMTIVGLAQLFAATVSVSLQPASQNANPNQTKTVSLVINAPSDTFNGGYVQIGFDSNMLSGAGLEAASGRFAVQQHSFSSNSAVFHFTTTNPEGESGQHTVARIHFTTKPVNGTQTAQISGGAVPYKTVGGNPQYYSASSLGASIIIAQGINPAPAPPPSPTPTPAPGPAPTPTPTPTKPSPAPVPQPSPSQVPSDNGTENVPIPGVTDGTIPENYGDVPGLFGDQVFGEEQRGLNGALKAFLIIMFGLAIVGGGLWFYKNFPKLAAKRQFKKADLKKPVSDNIHSHFPEEVRPTGEPTEKPMPQTPPPISHHVTHAFPEKNKVKSELPKTHSEPSPKSSEHVRPARESEETKHAPVVKKIEPEQKPKPQPASKPQPAPKPQPLMQARSAESPPNLQEPPKSNPPSVSATNQTQNLAPTVTMAGGIQKPWDDIRKDQAAKIAHAHKDLGADEDLPDMFELAEQHPESFGSQTLYDEENLHSPKTKKQ